MDVQPNEAELITAAQAGDTTAQAALYQCFQPLVLGYLIRLLGSVALAEDLCQDSFVKAFRALPKYRGEASLKNWLFQIVKNRVADHWKQHYTQLTVSMEEWYGSTEQALTDVESDNGAVEQKLQRILDQLPNEYRSILEYRFLRGYTIKESATALGISESNAKVRQYRALVKAKDLAKQL